MNTRFLAPFLSVVVVACAIPPEGYDDEKRGHEGEGEGEGDPAEGEGEGDPAEGEGEGEGDPAEGEGEGEGDPPHPEDAALMDPETQLVFDCTGTPLTNEQILSHFATGFGMWTPGALHADEIASVNAFNATRDCNELTGCEEQFSTGLGTDLDQTFAFLAEPDGTLSFAQYGTFGNFVGATANVSGEFVATLQTPNFDEQRFHVVITDSCFAVSTLPHASEPNEDGTWFERVSGVRDFNISAPVERPALEETPALENPPACTQTATTDQAIAGAYFEPGDTVAYFLTSAAFAKQHTCTVSTGCTPWIDDFEPNVLPTGLFIRNNQVLVALGQDDGTADLVDGAFSADLFNAHIEGFFTATCFHYTASSSIDGNRYNAIDSLAEAVGTPLN